MASLTKKLTERLTNSLKRFQPVLRNARNRDINESDTVVIVTDMLSELFGFDKYTEITSEYAVRGTYCDLAVKLEGRLSFLMEVKAIGLELKERHIRQSIDYAANSGLEWVAVTNGCEWKIFRVLFKKPIEQELVLEFSLLDIDPKDMDDLEKLYTVSREGFAKDALNDFYQRKQAINRYTIGAILQGEAVLKILRRELKLLEPGVNASLEEIGQVLSSEVLKREIIESEKTTEANRKLNRKQRKQQKSKSSNKESVGTSQNESSSPAA